MRGVLWRWLFGLGTVFWVGLCVADYHHKRLEKAFNLVESLEAKMPLPSPLLMTKQDSTPALTFWKWISMILSVSALIFIKRSSRIRPGSGATTVVSSIGRTNHYSSSRPASPKKITKLQEHYTWPKKSDVKDVLINSVPQALQGVQLVQQRLENLEQNIASLKHRIMNTSTYPTITSGPQALQNFLITTWKTISRSQLPSTCSIDSDSVSTTKLNVSGIPNQSESIRSDSLSISNATEVKEIIKGYTKSELLDEMNQDVITENSCASDNFLTCNYTSDDEEELSLQLSEMSSSKSSTNTDSQNPTEDWEASEAMSTTSSIQAIKLAGPVLSDHGFSSCESAPSVKKLLTRQPDNLVMTYMRNISRKTGESSSGVSSLNMYSDKYAKSRSNTIENRNHSGFLHNNLLTLFNWRY